MYTNKQFQHFHIGIEKNIYADRQTRRCFFSLSVRLANTKINIFPDICCIYMYSIYAGLTLLQNMKTENTHSAGAMLRCAPPPLRATNAVFQPFLYVLLNFAFNTNMKIHFNSFIFLFHIILFCLVDKMQ